MLHLGQVLDSYYKMLLAMHSLLNLTKHSGLGQGKDLFPVLQMRN